MPLSAAGGLLLAERLPVLRAPAAAVMGTGQGGDSAPGCVRRR